MKVLLVGGGTAGHVSPLCAVYREILKKDSTAEVLYVGRTNGGENAMMESTGVKTKYTDVTPLRFSSVQSALKSFENLKRSIAQSEQILHEFSPDVILSSGGYVSYPILKVGQKMEIPYYLHESNRILGKVNRMFAKGAEAVLCGNPDLCSSLKLPNKVFVGNPVKEEFFTTLKRSARRSLKIPQEAFFLLSVGGSGGAEAINDLSVHIAKRMDKIGENCYYTHITGRRYYDSYLTHTSDLKSISKNFRVLPYTDRMAELLCAADTVICRAGALTIAEAAAAGTPALLIPSPNVKGNHQYKNALGAADAGFSYLIEESELAPDYVVSLIEKLYKDDTLRLSMKNAARKYSHPESAARIADIILGSRNQT